MTKPHTAAEQFPYHVIQNESGCSIYRGCSFIEKAPTVEAGVKRISELYKLERDAMGGQFLP
jgi:hypothetical protein